MSSSTPFSDAYDDVLDGVSASGFSIDSPWADYLVRARKLCRIDGFDIGQASLLEDLRKTLSKAVAKGTGEAASLLAFAGEKLAAGSPRSTVDVDLAERVGALKVLRHTYLLKRSGAHRVWCVSIPPAYTQWPTQALQGGLPAVVAKLSDTTDRFGDEDRKHLSDASLAALRWVHKAMIVSGDMTSKKNFERVARWFADGTCSDQDVVDTGALLNAGLKKIATKLMSGRLIYTDHVVERGTGAFDGVEAFVWNDKLDVVYIENEFFGRRNTLTGLTNWARIVIHELTHRELNTDDHAYEHEGMAPKKIGMARARTNADSWAWFCLDCAGGLTHAQIATALAR